KEHGLLTPAQLVHAAVKTPKGNSPLVGALEQGEGGFALSEAGHHRLDNLAVETIENLLTVCRGWRVGRQPRGGGKGVVQHLVVGMRWAIVDGGQGDLRLKPVLLPRLPPASEDLRWLEARQAGCLHH